MSVPVFARQAPRAVVAVMRCWSVPHSPGAASEARNSAPSGRPAIVASRRTTWWVETRSTRDSPEPSTIFAVTPKPFRAPRGGGGPRPGRAAGAAPRAQELEQHLGVEVVRGVVGDRDELRDRGGGVGRQRRRRDGRGRGHRDL